MLDKSLLFANGQAALLFQSFINDMDKNASEGDFEHLLTLAKPNVLGPQVKNKYTVDFETIISALLTNNPQPKFEEIKGRYTVEIGSKKYNLQDILEKMQRTQIHLTANQLTQYVKYIEDEATTKPALPGEGVVTCERLKKKATKLQELHPGEVGALNIYTQNYYDNINKLLRGFGPFTNKSPSFQKDMREVMLHTAASLSGISKGKDEDLPLTYRYDSNYLPKEILEQRIKCAQSKGANVELFEDAAFVSGAAEKPASHFVGPYRTVFHGLHGVDVREISFFPDEREFLMPPSKIKYLFHREQNGKHYFLACPVIPPASSKLILNLSGGGNYKEVQKVINDAERDMIKKFSHFVIAATDHYLIGKAERDMTRWSLFSVADNTVGKGSYKLQYANKIKQEAANLIKELESDTIEPKVAYGKLAEIIHESTANSTYLDNMSLSFYSGKKSTGELVNTLQTVCEKVEEEMDHLVNFRNSMHDYFADKESFFQDDINLKVIGKLHKNFLSQPYSQSEKDIDPYYGSEWTLKCANNKVLNRPNHGLAHTLRGVALVPEVFCFYATQSIDNKTREVLQNLTKEDIKKMQVAMLFSVVGRKSELGFADNPGVYKKYREQCAKYFEDYAKKYYSDLFTSQDEINYWKQLVIDFGNPGFQPQTGRPEQAVIAKIMRQCHCLDLLRCYPKDEFHSKVSSVLKNDLGLKAADELINYSKELIEETGDRLTALDKDYDLDKHYKNNHDVSSCVNTINAISSAPHQNYAIKTEEEFPSLKMTNGM